MPKRLLDGDALWGSDKLAKVQPLEFRAEYANLIPLAEADGTFECGVRKVWVKVYATNRPDITEDLVEEILNEFERVNLLVRKTDENGKVWGFWVGIETRLPTSSIQERCKQGKFYLFKDIKNSVEQVKENFAEVKNSDAGFGLGLVREGLGIGIGLEGSDEKIKNIGQYTEGTYGTTNPKKIYKHTVEIWQGIKGKAAVARYPSMYPKPWEELCENHGGDLIVPAFELWAHENALYSQSVCPIGDFLRVAANFMDRVLPTAKRDKEKEMAAQASIESEKYRLEQEEKVRQLREAAAAVPSEDIFG